MAAKITENVISFTDSDVQNFFKAEENQNTKRKIASYSTLGMEVFITEKKVNNWKICQISILAVYLRRGFYCQYLKIQ